MLCQHNLFPDHMDYPVQMMSLPQQQQQQPRVQQKMQQQQLIQVLINQFLGDKHL